MPRILVDVSSIWKQLCSTPPDVWEVQRRTALSMLQSGTQRALAVVFDDEDLFAIDSAAATVWLSSPATSTPPTPVEDVHRPADLSATGGHLLAGARRLARKSRTLVGGNLLRLAPEPARVEWREAFHHAEAAIRVWRQPPTPPGSLSVGQSPNRPPVNLKVSPGREDVIWTCGPSPGSAALRWMAEVKHSHGFRVTSVCLGVDGAATIDQLDAADVIICGSTALRDRLNEVALASGRPTPNVCIDTPDG